MTTYSYGVACDCRELELRQRRVRGGAIQFVNQCRRCGRVVGGAVAKSKVRGVAAWFDEGLQERWSAQAASGYQAKKEQEQREWWDWYSSYLRSPEWREKRQKVLARDRICQACLERVATQAHHLTYQHAGNEPLFDLVGVCHECHETITAMDREARA